jgi:hypothetical protein
MHVSRYQTGVFRKVKVPSAQTCEYAVMYMHIAIAHQMLLVVYIVQTVNADFKQLQYLLVSAPCS